MVAPITIGAGITVGAGSIGGVITYAEMSPPVIPGNQLEDSTATINGSVGFTINDGLATGVAVPALTAENQTFFINQGTGIFTAQFGTGSTYSSATVNIVNSGPFLVFFIDSGLTYPATFNYPFTIA